MLATLARKCGKALFNSLSLRMTATANNKPPLYCAEQKKSDEIKISPENI